MPRSKQAPVRNAAQERLRDEPTLSTLGSHQDEEEDIIDLIDDGPLYDVNACYRNPYVHPIVRSKPKPKRKKQKLQHESQFEEFLRKSNYYIPVKSKILFV